jgi:hypothetical protein
MAMTIMGSTMDLPSYDASLADAWERHVDETDRPEDYDDWCPTCQAMTREGRYGEWVWRDGHMHEETVEYCPACQPEVAEDLCDECDHLRSECGHEAPPESGVDEYRERMAWSRAAGGGR